MVPRLTLTAAAIALAASVATAQSPELTSFIETKISAGDLNRALWGVRIEEEDGTVLFDRNGSRLMIPASSRKLLTSAFADACLGPNTTLETTVWFRGDAVDGVVRGDLILRGDGDPWFGGRFIDQQHLFDPVIDALRARGIRTIRGGVVADVSLFSSDTIPGSWKNDNLGESYAAPVDALAYNENVIGFELRSTGCNVLSMTADPELRRPDVLLACGSSRDVHAASDDTNRLRVRGSLNPNEGWQRTDDLRAVEEPGLFAAQALDAALARAGIAREKAPRSSREPVRSDEKVAGIRSQPVWSMLNVILENSQNLYAEMLLKRAAVNVVGKGVNYEAAVDAERAFLTAEARLLPTEFSMRDGSGLSPDDLVAPAALVKVLRYMMEPSRRGRFFAILDHPGSTGTLRRRLAGLENVVLAKTGSINGVIALSGVVRMPGGKLRYFSFMVNHYAGEPVNAREAIDAVVRELAGATTATGSGAKGGTR